MTCIVKFNEWMYPISHADAEEIRSVCEVWLIKGCAYLWGGGGGGGGGCYIHCTMSYYSSSDILISSVMQLVLTHL